MSSINNDVKQPNKRCEVNVTKLEVPRHLLRRKYQLQIETAPSEAIRNQGDRTGTSYLGAIFMKLEKKYDIQFRVILIALPSVHIFVCSKGNQFQFLPS